MSGIMSGGASWALIRPRRASATLTRLQLLASGVTTLLSFAVAMLAFAIWWLPSDEPAYRILAIALVGLLLVPLVTLGTATARLAARSRDDRLATLRLLGASAGRVRRIAVAEVTLVAACGVVIGTVLAAALPLALRFIPLHGGYLALADFLLPWWLAAGIPPLLVGVASLSALLGLRRVVISPLGVRTRQDAPRTGWLRLVLGLAVIGAALLVAQAVSPAWGVVVIVGVLAAVALAVMAVLGIVGPFVIALIARLRAVRTGDAARLVAARGTIDDPKTTWRGVSGLALATFVAIPIGSLLGYLDRIKNSESRSIMSDETLLLFGDARTILLTLVAITFIVVACQAAITQTAAVLERRDLFIALDRIGMPLRELNRSRRLSVTMPAMTAVIGSAVAAVALVFPVVLAAAVMAPLFLVGVAGILAAGLLLVTVGASATAPVLRRTLTAPARGE